MSEPGGERFPRCCRLTQRRQFQIVYDEGRRVSSRSFTLFARKNDVGCPRLGVTVTRRVGSAARRNRIKRRMREIFRRHRRAFTTDLDMVVNIHRTIGNALLRDMETEFLACLARLDRSHGR